MARIAIVALAGSALVLLLAPPAATQEPARARADEPGSGRVSGARTMESPRWPLASLASAARADAGSGQLIFNNACRTCHTLREGDNRLGPNLHNIVGRKAGSLPDFGYSSAMKGADFAWDEEKLDRFIAKPDDVVPGNSMKPYGGLASPEDRSKIIAFLQSSTAN
jgi:cytochrome c